MSPIIFKTKYLCYEISEDGMNRCFRFENGEDRLIPSPAAVITNNDRSEVYSVKASLTEDVLTLSFSDGTTLSLLAELTDEYVTFTLKDISRSDFLSVSLLNVSLRDENGEYEAVMMGMTLSVRMAEHPGDNRSLVATAYPHIGLFGTKKSKNPARIAFFAAPRDEVRRIERTILEKIPDGEIPKSKTGGPYSDLVKKAARGDYFILMQDTATLDKVDGIIDEMRTLGLTQITLHHNTHYRQGDFLPKTDAYPGGVSDFKAVVDKFHENGILVGLQTYSFFLARNSSYVTPIPHRDLDVLNTFTLKENVTVDALSLEVCEPTDGIVSEEGFIFVNSPYLWIEDEIVRFTRAEDGRFILSERGAYGTMPSAHKSGCAVKQLKQYFLLPLAKAGSELFYEIAKNTAEFFNESGADYFYLDALDGSFVLDGEDYVWYHAMDFIREMFLHLKRDIIFDCCYNPQYTGSWFVRSRYGAIDVSLNAHRACFDAHTEYNEKTARRMDITPELGWIDLFPQDDDPERLWLNEQLFPEDIEYVCAKAFATGASLAFLESFRKHKSSQALCRLSKILSDYSTYRQEKTPTDECKSFLLKKGNGAILRDGQLYASNARILTFEKDDTRATVINNFKGQIPSFRLFSLCAADEYDHPDAITLYHLDPSVPITEEHVRLDSPVDSEGRRGLGVRCKGDGSGALVTVAIRNLALNSRKKSEHYIKADFTGWRDFAFYETQNATLPEEIKEPPKLEYVTYNHLQEFYGYYRAKMNYSAIDALDITVDGSDRICLDSIRLIPHVSPVIRNPKIRFGSNEMQIYCDIPANSNLYFDGKECTVYDVFGNEIAKPDFIGTPFIENGANDITLLDDEGGAFRARLTVFTVGEVIN